MGLKLNKLFFLITAFTASFTLGFAQEDMRYSDKDYHNKKQFEGYRAKRLAVGAWQINQLKNGALVVRLKTNQLLINALLKNADTLKARAVQLETAAINLNTIKAYIDNYNFSKLYFIYSSSSDSLLNGKRENIFIDTNLVVNPNIVMVEEFYLLAERDKAYSSTIGFVKEDTAKFVSEGVNAVKEMAVVIKNKYGHQLKAPFPYLSLNRIDKQPPFSVVICINGIPIPFNVKRGMGLFATKSKNKYKGMVLNIPKYALYSRIALAISNLNDELRIYYLKNLNQDIEKLYPELKPFLY